MAPVFKTSNKKQDDGNRHHRLAIKPSETTVSTGTFYPGLMLRLAFRDVSLLQVLIYSQGSF